MLDSGLLAATLTVPTNVVFRTFPAETVMLNLDSGQYHGLNETAGAFLERTQQGASVAEAADAIAAAYHTNNQIVRADMCVLIQALVQRGLVEVQPPTP